MVNLSAKPFFLNETQIRWVEDTIASMTEEQKIKQLFVHLTGAGDDEAAVKEEAETMQGERPLTADDKEEGVLALQTG